MIRFRRTPRSTSCDEQPSSQNWGLLLIIDISQTYHDVSSLILSTSPKKKKWFIK